MIVVLLRKLTQNVVSQIFFGYEIQVSSDIKSEINFDSPNIISDLTYDETSFFLLHNSGQKNQFISDSSNLHI